MGGLVDFRRHMRTGLLQTRRDMGVVLDAGLIRGLGHLRRKPYACLVCVVRGPVLGRVGVGRHHFRGVQHAVLRRTGRGAHAVDAGHGILLLGGVRYFDFPPFYGSCLSTDTGACEGGHPGHAHRLRTISIKS